MPGVLPLMTQAVKESACNARYPGSFLDKEDPPG